MKKYKSKPLLLAAMTGLFLLAPVRNAYIPETPAAAEVNAAHDSKLSAFDIAPGTLSPAFSPDITEYTSTVNADVTSVSVQAVPRASGAVIASVEGRDGLQPGVNTIKVTCSAQDNTFTVYTITLTVGSADAGAQQPADTQPEAGNTVPAQPDDTQPEAGGTADTLQPDTTQPDTGRESPDADTADSTQSDTETQAGSTKSKRSLAQRLSGTIKADGTVKLSGAEYKLSGNFSYGSTTQDIPSAFGQGSVQIGDTTYPTLYCQTNGVHLVYMENTDGNGSTGFYFYDELKNVVERFKYTGIGDNFVVFISNAREEVPAGYAEKSLKLPSDKKVAAYQSEYSDELKDYYLVYGINSNGTSGWYFYDKSQGTYLRYSNAFAAAQGLEDEDGGEDEVERTVSLTKYNSLNEKYTELKENRVKIVSILIVAMILLIIIFTAILLRSREDEDDEEEADSRVRSSKKKKTKKAAKQSETISKSSLAAGRNFEGNVSKRSKKVTKTFTQEPPQAPQKKSAVRDDHISTPEEIRAQVSSGQTNYGQESRIKRGSEQGANEQRMNGQRFSAEQHTNGQQINDQWSDTKQRMNEQRGYTPAVSQREQLLKKPSAGSPDTVQIAAERMRQSVKYPRRASKAETQEPAHDPMDDWDMEETVSRKAQKAGKASRKKRSRMEDDMEIMDLNDL